MTTPENPNPGPPPVTNADTLYDLGMAHYQRREWKQALDCFEKLKQVEPNRPGLDSLIDEASWFLQLQQVEAQPGPLQVTDQPYRRRSVLAWLAPVLLIALLLVVLAALQGWIPGLSLGRSIEQEALFTRGESSLAVGDYETARAAFTELARLAPDDPAVQEGLARANRLEAMALAYAAAQQAIQVGDWPAAEARLEEVLAADPSYGDAEQLILEVRHQREAATRFAAGVAAYDAGDLAGAIEQLEGLVEFDRDYQSDAVRELLFVVYLGEGQATLAIPEAGADQIRQAIGRFGQALSLRPRNQEALEASQLANQLLSARRALDGGDQRQAETVLAAIVDARPDFADGQVAALLYRLLLQRAENQRDLGQIAEARSAYQQALALPVPDTVAAQAGLDALVAFDTPTPIAAATPTTTPTPLRLAAVIVDSANVRSGPGSAYSVRGQVEAGTQLILLSRNEGGDWLEICCIDQQPGWIAARLLTTAVTVADLPVAVVPTLPPLPTATPTSPPTPAPEPTPSLPTTPAEPPPAPTSTPTPPPR